MGNIEFEKILVPVDGSDANILAQECAAVVAQKTKVTVTVFHVTNMIEEYYRMLYAVQGLEYDIPIEVTKEIIDFTKKETSNIIANAQTFFNKKRIKVETKTVKDFDPAQHILEYSREMNYGLVILGARGTKEKDFNQLGSVAKKVVRHTTCPTLLVKESCSLSNLLVCIDGSKNSIKALDYANKLVEKIGSRMTLLNVQGIRSYIGMSPHARSVFKRLGERILSRALSAIGKESLKVQKRVEFGVISDKICEVAEKEDHDLIVLGSRGIGTVKRFFLGSVSDDVVHKTKRSVLIIPAKPQ